MSNELNAALEKPVKHIPIECWTKITRQENINALYQIDDANKRYSLCYGATPINIDIRNQGGQTYLVTVVNNDK